VKQHREENPNMFMWQSTGQIYWTVWKQHRIRHDWKGYAYYRKVHDIESDFCDIYSAVAWNDVLQVSQLGRCHNAAVSQRVAAAGTNKRG